MGELLRRWIVSLFKRGRGCCSHRW